MNSIQTSREGVTLILRVAPRASKDEIVGDINGVLKIRLQAPPVDGKANKALIKFLAKKLDAPARDISIVSGETARIKRVLIKNVAEADVRKAVRPAHAAR